MSEAFYIISEESTLITLESNASCEAVSEDFVNVTDGLLRGV